MHYYITTIKQDLEYNRNHYNELMRELRYCMDKNVIKLLEIETKHTLCIINRIKRTMKEMEKLV